MNKRFLKWNEINTPFNNLDKKWSDISILIDIDNRAKGSGGYAAYVKSNPWDKVKEDFGDENLKKVVKLYFEYKGYEYNGEVEKNELIKITTSEFETFIKDKISSIKVNVSF